MTRLQCPLCKRELGEGDSFCMKCGLEGVPIPDVQRDKGAPPQDDGSKNKTQIIIACIVTVAIVAIVAIAFYSMNMSGRQSKTSAGVNNTGNASSVTLDDVINAANEEENRAKGSSSSSSKASSSRSNAGLADGSNSVSLSVKARNGETISGQVRRNSSGYVIPDSSTREYSLSELRALGLSDAELCIAWNEPFARNGYHFKNSGLQKYFESCSWYTDRGNQSNLSGAAALNNSRLREIAEERESSRRWEELAEY